MNNFKTASGFCNNCGSILPLLRRKGIVSCYTCKREYPDDLFVTDVEFTVTFNAGKMYNNSCRHITTKQDDEGPIIDRKCPKCGNEKMSYATLQIRSADEGQTVFYTCTKCKFKETENS